MAKITLLENLCYDYVIQKLEEFKTEDLSLLPKKYRVRALLQLPIVDVCRLEDTQFTADIAMDAIWEQLYEKYIGSTASIKPKENWKQSFLSKFLNTILNGSRLYGYFQVLMPLCDFVSDAMEDGISEHPADNTNYLVAMNRDEPYPWRREQSLMWLNDEDTLRFYNASDTILTSYQVTLCRGVLSPGKAYEQGCENNQVVPPRYMTLLNPRSRFLPNITALELIKKCGFHLKAMNISLPTFGTFLLHAQQERADFLEFLRIFFSTVESVTFCNPQDRIPSDLQAKIKYPLPSQELLKQGMETFATAMLKSISIVADNPQPVFNCVMPVLATSPSCLETFKYESYLELDDTCFQQLQSAIQQYSTLRTISIQHVEMCDLGIHSVLWKSISPWMEISLANQFLQSLEFILRQISMDTFLNMLTTFLSAPCLQKQTLSLKIVFARGQGIAEVSRKRNADFFTEQLEKVDKKLLQKKSIEFVKHVSFSAKFSPIRLGGLIATRIPSGRIATLLQQFLASEVQFNSIELSSFKTISFYRKLFQGEQLKSIIFNNCANIQPLLLKQAATEQRFRFEAPLETNSNTVYTVTKEIV